MAKYIELIDKYRIEQGDGDYNPPSYVWVDNTGEIVRCKDCDSWDTEQSSGRKSLGNYVCICQEWSDGEDARWVYTGENEYCSRGEPKEKTEVQE